MSAKIKMDLQVENWSLRKPFRITGETITNFPVLVMSLRQGDLVGRGEAIGVSYLEDDVPRMLAQLEALRQPIEAGDGRLAQRSLPIGGARNALDCALWDLAAKVAERPVWQLLGLTQPGPIVTTYTLGADTPEAMAQGAAEVASARALKLKLTGESVDAERVRAVRTVRPDVWLSVDANRGFTRASLEKLLPTLVDTDVRLIEQPFALGRDADLDGLEAPIPIAADESIQGIDDLREKGHWFDVVNIKLDKCGGLTEGLEMAREAERLGLQAMVGTMGGTSLAMAPGFLVGQLCQVVDLDGPTLLSRDRHPEAAYKNGTIWCGPEVWGGPVSAS